MRAPRILGEPAAEASHYDVMSRAIEGRFVFDDVAKERFRTLLEAHAAMAGIEVYTWCCMSNHFHILLRVPNAERNRALLDDPEVLRRLALVMSRERVREVRQMLERLKEQGEEGGYDEFRERLLARMFDLSAFMRELKQRFAQWHNRRVKRKGPLFEERFKSVLLEEGDNVLLTMAAYIDLNPVRAGLVKDPKDYRWCGYAEAVAGKACRRAGLVRLHGDESRGIKQWKAFHVWYRSVLFGRLEKGEHAPMGESTRDELQNRERGSADPSSIEEKGAGYFFAELGGIEGMFWGGLRSRKHGGDGLQMRAPRILGEPAAEANHYHVMSRAIEGRFVFDDVAKERFRALLEAHAAMAGIEVYTWCCMSNHFHILLQVPNAERNRAILDDTEVLRRLALVMSRERVKEVGQMLARLKEQREEGGYHAFRERLLARMFDLSAFMRELKQRFAQWHNRRVKRKGPLFEDRFKSVLLEEGDNVLLTMAAYIDLNPVRAGLVKDPKDYRWCGYAEAVAGKAWRRAGLIRIHGDESRGIKQWKAFHAWYRSVLFGRLEKSEHAPVGESTRDELQNRERGSADPSSIGGKERERGYLNIAQLTRVRVRYFTQSLALGSREWVEAVFVRNRKKLKVKRQRGARRSKEVDLGDWRGLVDVRMEVKPRSV